MASRTLRLSPTISRIFLHLKNKKKSGALFKAPLFCFGLERFKTEGEFDRI
jgi:hypothetical protein